MTNARQPNTESIAADLVHEDTPERRPGHGRRARGPLRSRARRCASTGAGGQCAECDPAVEVPAKDLGPSGDALLPLATSSERVVTTPQPVYMLPRDHTFHASQFYANNQFWEWHYWSGFCKDAAGNDYALFFGTDPVGYDPKTGGFGLLPAVFSISPIKEGRKYYCFNNFPSFEARLPADSTSPANFLDLLRNDEAGFNDDGRYNSQMMHGLSYYYIAPNMPFTGKVGFGGRTVEVKGSVWLEHQWGSIKGMDQGTAAGAGSASASTTGASSPGSPIARCASRPRARSSCPAPTSNSTSNRAANDPDAHPAGAGPCSRSH
jgi:hypothetical protein